MTDTLTIRFRAKLDGFAGGRGYKVPALKNHHVSLDGGGMVGVTIVNGIERGVPDTMTRARIEKYGKIERFPGVVWADGADEFGIQHNDERWVVTPVGKGFMADVSITLPLTR